MIVGITGYNASGKDTAADFLIEEGYEHLSLSDEIRSYLRKKGIEESRESLINTGNLLRKKEGNGTLAKRVLKRTVPGKDYVITSIRHPEEVKELKKTGKFLLFFIESPTESRLQRIKTRKRAGDPKTLKELLSAEKKEQKSGANQQMHKMKRLADAIILNDGTLEGFREKTVEAVNKERIKRDMHRPDWDEYFFGIMEAVSRRATCDRGKSGAILVKNKQIIATGYVGAPKGLPHCDHAGHLYGEVLREGKVHLHCIRTTHAEMNAIVQAAKSGVSTEGATIYCKMEPCLDCCKAIINAGIKRVVALKKYHGAQNSREFFKQAGVKLDVMIDEVQEYDNQIKK